MFSGAWRRKEGKQATLTLEVISLIRGPVVGEMCRPLMQGYELLHCLGKRAARARRSSIVAGGFPMPCREETLRRASREIENSQLDNSQGSWQTPGSFSGMENTSSLRWSVRCFVSAAFRLTPRSSFWEMKNVRGLQSSGKVGGVDPGSFRWRMLLCGEKGDSRGVVP